VSRSIWPQDVGWHGCVRCDDLQPFDNSRYLIETVNNLRQQLAPQTAAVWPLVSIETSYKRQAKK
jgi:hypothetical protein